MKDFVGWVKMNYVWKWMTGQLWWASRNIIGEEASVIIFTTRSTGKPKPAVVSQKGMIAQAKLVSKGFKIEDEKEASEMFATWIVTGITAVWMWIFKAEEKKSDISCTDSCNVQLDVEKPNVGEILT